MKKLFRFKYYLPVIVLGLFFGFIPSDSNRKDNTLMQVVIQSLTTGHYTPLEIDDAFSEKAFKLYIDRLDYSKRFLIKNDIEKLEQYRYLIDDEIRNNNLDFFTISTNIINTRIREAEDYYKDILKKPFDFTAKEYLELNPDKREFAATKKELKEIWSRILKFETLERLDDLIKAQEKAVENNDTAYKVKTLTELEEEARAKVMKSYDNLFHRISQIEEEDRFTYYINAIANIYDPHTGYFPPKDKEDFDIRMSGSLEGIGAQLTQQDEYIKVSSIVPGSPSWKQGELKEGDIILKVAQGNEEPVDVVDMRLDKAVRLIRGDKGTEVRLTVKKIDGSIVVISIIRDVVILDETYAKSAIISEKKSGRRIGYIKLPSFYVDFSNPLGRNASDDIKNELEKLEKEKIDGIVIDLRNDGGGSLVDAVDIAGMFIDKGPVVQVKTRYGAPYIYRDNQPGIIYNGPLVILVNSFSASASEIFAAAMQDYGRGLIIGSPSTYGKGTVQKFADLDEMVSANYNDVKPLGSIKLTLQKFYRINGGATQLKGVVPDIILDDQYSYIDIGEKENEYPMPWDEIEPVDYVKYNSSYPLDKIAKKMNREIEEDSTFILVRQNAQRLKLLEEETLMPLNLTDYQALMKKREQEAEKYSKINEEPQNIDVKTPAADLPGIEADSAKLERTSAWYKNLQKDIYLYKAVRTVASY